MLNLLYVFIMEGFSGLPNVQFFFVLILKSKYKIVLFMAR